MNSILKLKCPAFENGMMIPKKYTGEGEDLSPPIRWSHISNKVKELVLICEDPDAPQTEPWVHWLVYNISPSISCLPEGLGPDSSKTHAIHVTQGKNSFGKIGYNGPMPPENHGPHRYFFKLYALGINFFLEPGVTKEELMEVIRDHIIDEAVLIGKYERKAKMKAA